MVLPYCDKWDWACLRGLSLGLVATFTLIVLVYLLRKVLPVTLRTGWYKVNCTMLLIACIEVITLVIHCLITRNAKLLFLSKYFRGIQISITCLLYGRLAIDVLEKKALILTCLLPTVVASVLMMTINLIVMLTSNYIDCRHTSWLVMSLSGAILAVSFAIAGRVVLSEIRVITSQQYQYKSLIGMTEPIELHQSHQQLWILLLFNTLSAVVQLILDLYISLVVVAGRSCTAMFFADENVELEQCVRLFLSLIGYVLPQWIVIYVFYWIPRHQFSTHLDVPDLDFDEVKSNSSDGYYYFNDTKQEAVVQPTLIKK